MNFKQLNLNKEEKKFSFKAKNEFGTNKNHICDNQVTPARKVHISDTFLFELYYSLKIHKHGKAGRLFFSIVVSPTSNLDKQFTKEFTIQ